MCNYDLEILQYNEFENLTRDLLQAHFDIYIESFKDGKDGGIDLRYGEVCGTKTIVQVKRYKDWESLKGQLQKEAAKVQKLQPNRYILSTSAPLSPANKETIMAIFDPFIKDSADIFGKDDINNLLGQHSEIEKKYYKLWLASTEVLNDLLHKNIRNWSNFEIKTIQSEIKTYVSNKSFEDALQVLDKHKYVIISGIPGIGKTTLARMLVYELLAAQKFDEFVCIEENLHEGATLFQEGKKQVFFFDDFLGSNTFEEGEKGFDNKLLSFISAVQREPDKRFIMTTREYILAQAKEHYEKLNTCNIEIAKCTIDLGVYSMSIRAKILYNHMAEANLPAEYVEQLLCDKNYLKIINHRYFNPRVIETYIDKKLWQQEPPERFVSTFIQAFDNPTLVWKWAYNSLAPIAQYALLVLATMGGDVCLDDWNTAFHYFCQSTDGELHLPYSDEKWRNSLKILEDCFIRIGQMPQGGYRVKLYNPSILGFVVEYIKDLHDVLRQLITGAYYVEQLYSIFTTYDHRVHYGDGYVKISQKLSQMVRARFIEMMNTDYKSCSLDISYLHKNKRAGKIDILLEFDCRYSSEPGMMEQLISEEDLINPENGICTRLHYVQTLDWEQMGFDRENVIRHIMEEDKNIIDLKSFVEKMHMIGHDDILQEASFIEELQTTIEKTLVNRPFNSFDRGLLTETIEKIAKGMPENVLPFDEYLQKINAFEEGVKNHDYHEEKLKEKDPDADIDDNSLEEMMTSLRVF